MGRATPHKSSPATRGAESRERILNAAESLFQERGYAGLSISAICERAEIAPTSIYWHFGEKAGLLRAVIERASGGYAARIRESVALAGSDPEEQLEALVTKIRELVTTQPPGSLSFVVLLSGGGPVSDELRSALSDAHRSELDSIAEDCDRVFGPGEGRTVGLMVLAFVNYAALMYRVTRDAKDVEEVLDAMRALLRSRLPGPVADG